MIPAELSLRDFGVLERATAHTHVVDGKTYITQSRLAFSGGQVIDVRLVEETCELSVFVGPPEDDPSVGDELPMLADCVGMTVSEVWWMENSRGYLDGLQVQFWNDLTEGEPAFAFFGAQNAEIEVCVLAKKS